MLILEGYWMVLFFIYLFIKIKGIEINIRVNEIEKGY